jgi:hypothetical protein
VCAGEEKRGPLWESNAHAYRRPLFLARFSLAPLCLTASCEILAVPNRQGD